MRQEIILTGLIVLSFTTLLVKAEHWAVLVAGSNKFWNYRHQADVCHSYKLLKQHGVLEKNIILMMYDDIAHDKANPFPGKRENVTPEKFLQVLLGNKSAGGKVLKSNENDRVFINFVDHGGPGLIAFPHGLLYANDLIETLIQMHKKKMYKELVFYMEACESGSMFLDLLPKDINIFATTAANAHESSWGAYCPPYSDIVNGISMNTCLGDLYSVNWMEDSDKHDLYNETIYRQFMNVKAKTKKSHVLELGDDKVANDPVGDFQSSVDALMNSSKKKESISHTLSNSDNIIDDSQQFGVVDSRNIALVSKFYAYLNAPISSRREYSKILIQELNEREEIDLIMQELQTNLLRSNPIFAKKNVLPKNFLCLKAVNEKFEMCFGKYSDYSMKYIRVFVDFCESSLTTEDLLQAVNEICLLHSVKVFDAAKYNLWT